MIGLENYKKALSELPKEINEAEVNIETNENYMLTVSEGEVVESSYSNTTEIFARATGEKTGFAYTQDLSEDPAEVIERAYRNSLEITDNKRDFLNRPILGHNQEKIRINCNVDIEEMKKTAASLEAHVLASHDSIEKVIVESRIDITESRVFNSHGLDVSSCRKVNYLKADVIAQYKGETYNTTCALSATDFEKIDFSFMIDMIINQLEGKFGAGSFEPGEYPVLLDKTVGVNILMTAWQLFSGIKYLEGSSALSGKLYNNIGSENFTVYDVPAHEKTGYIYRCDCEGSVSQAHTIVDKGRLVGLLHNISTASQMNTKSTGNAGRYALLSGTIPTDIIVTPKILYIEKGEESVDTLLKELNNGVYITESYDVFHSINIASGDFSIPCRGIVIKDGKKHRTITGMTISGNLLDLFKNIKATANDLYIEEFLMKSYCIGSPSLLLNKIQINAG